VAIVLTGGLAIAAGVVLAMSWTKHRGDVASGLAVRIEGAGSAHSVLHFSDGSEVSLGEGARARVRSMDEHGARVTLERGVAHVYVVHAPGTHWTFEAGPFVVAVTGTAFSLSWREDAQRLDVRLENGTVNVMGPASDAPLALRAGQWLSMKSAERGGEVRIRSLDATDDEAESGAASSAPPAAEPPPTPRAVLSAPEVPQHVDGSRRNGSGPAHDHNWAADLVRGRSEAIVEDALALGIDGVFAQSSGDELAALADAARYTHRSDIARGAFLAQRRRFPGSDHSRVAAFGLGRLEDADQDPRAALGWFDTYLAEAPNGRFASEALGRKMTLVKVLDGQDAARAWADLYLRRFPSGTYAAAARAVTGAP
jgi:TolA-binding protein